ncbi:ornithine cyclodeaminase family protein [Luteolibacter marinus]|uniref:ornithine cyclodeaminase family protein n=1 Tax=Luteolibacter marinus TaxID=2776705 RepID=UPI001868BFE5|nr:ornithine cyclodeaminase family protein [Luteolibacter marinus]
MKILSADDVDAALRFPDFVDALEESFAGGFTMPPRQVLALDPGGGGHDAFAMLPSWTEDVIALKAFTYFPENPPPYRSLYSKILLFDRVHGEPLALVDGSSVTYWRTAGVSALASRHLSREDSATLLLLGTGNLAPHLIRAHASVRPLERVRVWGRDPAKAAAVVAGVKSGFPAIEFEVVADLPAACRTADIVVGATGSPEILIRGEWLQEGTHCDFLGNHHATKRECDTLAVTRSRVFVDTRANCFKEAGEILVPVAEGHFSLDQVQGELADLCAGRVTGRGSAGELTLFKSVGCALGDLCGALVTYRASLG